MNKRQAIKWEHIFITKMTTCQYKNDIQSKRKKKRANELNDTLHTEKRINVYKCAWPH